MAHAPDHSVIGIGIREDPGRVFTSILSYTGPSEIRCYISPDIECPSSYTYQFVISSHPEEEMISDLFSGSLTAAIRGTLPAHETLRFLKKTARVVKLERVVLLETADGKRFILGPVGIDEGWSVAEKVSLIEKARPLCTTFGLSETVTILSGGRLEDTGRHPAIDQSLADGERVAQLTGAIHEGILIEEAVKRSGLIIAPDGISGNLIFRTLLFLGRGRSHGAPVINIGKIFIDTSRVNPDYHFALNLADNLIAGSFSKKN